MKIDLDLDLIFATYRVREVTSRAFFRYLLANFHPNEQKRQEHISKFLETVQFDAVVTENFLGAFVCSETRHLDVNLFKDKFLTDLSPEDRAAVSVNPLFKSLEKDENQKSIIEFFSICLDNQIFKPWM